MDREEYITVLKAKLDQLGNEIGTLRQKVGDLFAEIERKESQSNHILELLSAEGYQPSGGELMNSGQVRIPDLAEQYLMDRGAQDPIHYRDLADRLQSQGNAIAGKDPAANLLSQISRDERFVRVSPGTYGLRRWGLKPASDRRHRRKRK